MSNDDAFQRLKSRGRLPSPTGVVLEVLRLINARETTVEELGRVIESDPALTAKVIKTINAPLAGMHRHISSVSRAVVLLGFRTVASLALSIDLVQRGERTSCDAFDYDGFWSESLACAVAARHLVVRLKQFPPDEAFTGSLLSQIGRLGLATVEPDAYDPILTRHAADRAQLVEAERKAFGIDHPHLASAMMAEWGIPELFRHAVEAQVDPGAHDLDPESRAQLFARILHMSYGVAQVLVHSTVNVDTLSALTREAYHLGLEPGVFHASFDAISDEWRDAGQIYNVRTREVPSIADLHDRCDRERDALDERSEPTASAATSTR